MPEMLAKGKEWFVVRRKNSDGEKCLEATLENGARIRLTHEDGQGVGTGKLALTQSVIEKGDIEKWGPVTHLVHEDLDAILALLTKAEAEWEPKTPKAKQQSRILRWVSS